VNGITLHTVISGQTQSPFAGTLVLLHGFTGSVESWDDVNARLMLPG
jgi:pimeloyl-ACP methyl ester carboxylesterase